MQLWRRLSSTGPADLEIEAILLDPDLKAETARTLPAMVDAIRPCGATAVRNALQPLVLVFGIMEAAKSPGFWEPYLMALDGLPDRALAKGIADYASAADSEFFPKPGPLKALCEKHAQPMWQAVSRAKKVVMAREEPRPSYMCDAPNGKEIVAAKLKEYLAGVAARRPPPVAMRPNHGALAEGRHITPQLAALIDRQNPSLEDYQEKVGG